MMQTPMRAAGALACLAAVALTLGCEGRDPVILRLDGTEIRRSEFLAYLKGIETRGEAPLDPYLETRHTLGQPPLPEQPPWLAGGAQVETPYVRVPGLLRGECRSDEHGDYLALTIHPDPADPRARDILGEVRAGGKVLPEWGFHVIDMELAMGDLVRLVEAQAERWERR